MLEKAQSKEKASDTNGFHGTNLQSLGAVSELEFY